ncbi:hypothetical protein KM043_013449 [Ampulex compressa]|nr:hypothetical protein KM043_013449 [Ampulex compressa]
MNDKIVDIQDPFTLIERVCSFSGENASDFPDLPVGSITFINITNVKTYIFLYICQMPCAYTGLVHTSTVCIIVTLVLHICGKLSVLSYRIRNLGAIEINQWNNAMADMVQMHLKLVWMVKSIDDVFHLVLLVELVMTSARLGLYMYMFMVNIDTAQFSWICTFFAYVTMMLIFLYAYCFIGEQLIQENIDTAQFSWICTFLVYLTMMLIFLYAYCFIGEQLIQECRNLHDAYYYSNWEEMPKSYRKCLLICMIYAQKALHLTAGKFYIFSMEGFTELIKTSMAYVSMLRSSL